jgi:hypothetical protein
LGSPVLNCKVPNDVEGEEEKPSSENRNSFFQSDKAAPNTVGSNPSDPTIGSEPVRVWDQEAHEHGLDLGKDLASRAC